MIPRILVAVLATLMGCVACTNESTTDIDGAQSPWMLVDDFESGLEHWTNIDAENNTNPHVPNPQISEIRTDWRTSRPRTFQATTMTRLSR
jgi:hypothetical protein